MPPVGTGAYGLKQDTNSIVNTAYQITNHPIITR